VFSCPEFLGDLFAVIMAEVNIEIIRLSVAVSVAIGTLGLDMPDVEIVGTMLIMTRIQCLPSVHPITGIAWTQSLKITCRSADVFALQLPTFIVKGFERTKFTLFIFP